MRFNPKAQLDTSRTRDHGRGSGGGTNSGGRLPIPGGAKAGGGIGVLVVIIVALTATFLSGGSGGGGTSALDGLFGQSSTGDASRMGDSERYARCRTGADANDSEDCARVAVENSLYAYWEDLFAQDERRFRPATVNTFSVSTTSGCGRAASSVGPFYCPADQNIYLDTTFFEEVLEKQLGGQGGDFVEPYVLAHEYGHHIQTLLGTINKVRTQSGPDSDAVRLELQADCYAGMWTRAATGTTDVSGVAIIAELDRGDIEEAVDAAKTVGDDRIQQRSTGRIDSDHWTHGSSEQRKNWFLTGYEQGTLQSCDTFSARRL